MADVMHAPRMQQEMELAAFEKGRLQGELEASRRMESEQLHREKQLLPAHNAALPVVPVVQADIIEINRLTWLQRASALLGEACTWAQLALTIVWIEVWRGDFGWSNSTDGGNASFWHTHYLTNALGLFFLANAITNYRMLPLRTPSALNRLWYIFLQASVIVCFTLALVSIVRATPEQRVWNVWQWVWLAAYCSVMLHSLYSIGVALLEPLHHRHVTKKYLGANAAAAGHNGSAVTHPLSTIHRLVESPEQHRDHSAYNGQARSVYAPAPGILRRTHAAASTAVPTAPTAPRWSETPNTHAGSYFLMPRAKWAVVSFWAIGVAVLMDLAATQQTLASGGALWSSQVPAGAAATGVDRRGAEMSLLGALGIVTIGMLMMMSYVAMPPRTAIVKNGVVADVNAAARRTSISHNAETQIGSRNTGVHHNTGVIGHHTTGTTHHHNTNIV